MQSSLLRSFADALAGAPARSLVACAALALAVGCGDDDATGGSGANGGAGNGGAPSTGGNGNGGGPGTGGMGGQPECSGVEGDSPCVTCGKDACCEQYTACALDPACTACLACTETAEDPADCIGTECDVQQATTAHAFACANQYCNPECFAGASVCDPSGGDNACSTCAKQPTARGGCCDELETCARDPECVQCLGCVIEAEDPVAECTSICQFADPETSAFISCALGSCGDECNPQ